MKILFMINNEVKVTSFVGTCCWHRPDKQGEPLAGHRIEIWQSDVNGKYLHMGDSQSIPYDQGFRALDTILRMPMALINSAP